MRKSNLYSTAKIVLISFYFVFIHQDGNSHNRSDNFILNRKEYLKNVNKKECTDSKMYFVNRKSDFQLSKNDSYLNELLKEILDPGSNTRNFFEIEKNELILMDTNQVIFNDFNFDRPQKNKPLYFFSYTNLYYLPAIKSHFVLTLVDDRKNHIQLFIMIYFMPKNIKKYKCLTILD